MVQPALPECEKRDKVEDCDGQQFNHNAVEMQLKGQMYMLAPESVRSERGIGVDIVVKPPLHCHVPVAHAMPNLHAEICVITVNVLDRFEVILHNGVWIRTETNNISNTLSTT